MKKLWEYVKCILIGAGFAIGLLIALVFFVTIMCLTAVYIIDPIMDWSMRLG